MSNLQANRTLSGSFAEVWVDGARIAELSQLALTVKVQREKVQFGMDVDSKITGYAGEGTMTIKQVYTCLLYTSPCRADSLASCSFKNHWNWLVSAPKRA